MIDKESEILHLIEENKQLRHVQTYGEELNETLHQRVAELQDALAWLLNYVDKAQAANKSATDPFAYPRAVLKNRKRGKI